MAGHNTTENTNTINENQNDNNNNNQNKENNEQLNNINSEETKNNNNIINEEKEQKEENKSSNVNTSSNDEEKNKINTINEDNKIENNQNLNTNNNDINTNNNDENKDEDVLSAENFKKLYHRLHSIIVENKRLDTILKEITDIIESITEHLINGDKNDPEIFELFSSLNFIHDFIIIMNKRNRDVNIQIIKFFSVIMTNLSDEHLLYFIFNCDFINQHIYENNEPIDGDYLYYYTSFVKSLIIKINTKTITFFYHAYTYTFPLLGNILKFYNHSDSMICNTLRNIFLCILKMNHQPSIDYICSLPTITYFIFLSCRLRDEIKTLNKKISRNKEEDCMILHEQIINDIMFIQDIFSVGIEKINFILINSIFHFVILPIICNTLVYHSDLLEGNKNISSDMNNSNTKSNKPLGFGGLFLKFVGAVSDNNNNNNENNIKNALLKLCISTELAIYILNVFFKYIKNETFINTLVCLLFSPKIHYRIMQKLKTPIKDLENYVGDYKNEVKKKVSFTKYITENYSIEFIKAQMSNPNNIYVEFKKLEKKVRDRLVGYNIPYNLNHAVPYGFLMDAINGFYPTRELKECRDYHEIISESTGIQCGLSYHKDRRCIIYLMKKNLQLLKDDYAFEKNEKKYIENEIYTSFVKCYKDCNEILLLLFDYLFHQIINNEFVSKKLLEHAKLINANELNKIINNGEEEVDDTPVLQVGNIIESKEKEKEKIDEKNNKKKFNDLITFSNLYKVMYKTDLTIKEFNLFDNQILKQNIKITQTEYNTILLGDTINYLNRDSTLKPYTYLFIFRLFNDLMIYEEKNEKKSLKLREGHKSIINSAFSKNIDHIKNIINEGGKINEKDLNNIHAFLCENKTNYIEDYNKLIKEIMKDCMFLKKKEDNEENNDNFIKGIEMFNNFEISDSDLKIRVYFLKLFLIIYNALYERNESEIKLTELNEENKNNAKNIIIDNLNKLIVLENENESGN